MGRNFQRLKVRIKKNRTLSFFFTIPVLFRRIILSTQQNRKNRNYQSLFRFFEYGTVAVKVEAFCGIFEIDIRSDILKRLILNRQYEEEIVKLCRNYLPVNQDIVDVGANIGLFTVYFAKSIPGNQRVLAIEPIPNAINLLKKNLINNNVSSQVVIYEGLVSDIASKYQIKTIPGKEEYSTMGENINQTYDHHRPYQQISVLGNTIDGLVMEFRLNPGFIKIDVEGAEYLVLKGSEQTIKIFRPVVFMEVMDSYMVNFGHSSSQIIEFFQANHYKVFDISTEEYPVCPFNGNIIAIPI